MVPDAGGRTEAPTPEQLTEQIAASLRSHAGDVICAYFFGSRRTGQAGPLGDLDVAVLLDEAFNPGRQTAAAAAIVEALESCTGLRTDLTILNDAPPALAHRAVREGRLVLVRDERRRVAFETRAIRESLDFQPVLDRFDRVLFDRAREGRLGS